MAESSVDKDRSPQDDDEARVEALMQQPFFKKLLRMLRVTNATKPLPKEPPSEDTTKEPRR